MPDMGGFYDLVDDDGGLQVGYTCDFAAAEDYVRVERAAGYSRSFNLRQRGAQGDGGHGGKTGLARWFVVKSGGRGRMAVFYCSTSAIEYSSACNDGGAGTSVEAVLVDYGEEGLDAIGEDSLRRAVWDGDAFGAPSPVGGVPSPAPAPPAPPAPDAAPELTPWQRSVWWMLLVVTVVVVFYGVISPLFSFLVMINTLVTA